MEQFGVHKKLRPQGNSAAVKILSDRHAGCRLLGADENLKGKSLYNTLYGPNRSCRGDLASKKGKDNQVFGTHLQEGWMRLVSGQTTSSNVSYNEDKLQKHRNIRSTAHHGAGGGVPAPQLGIRAFHYKFGSMFTIVFGGIFLVSFP